MRWTAYLETSCCSAATRTSRREPESASAKGQINPISTSTFEGNVVHATIHGGCGGSNGAIKEFVIILLSRNCAASSSSELACRLLTWAASTHGRSTTVGWVSGVCEWVWMLVVEVGVLHVTLT